MDRDSKYTHIDVLHKYAIIISIMCIAYLPDNATFVDQTFLGGPYDNIKINIWKFPENGTENRLAVTQNECYPVFGTVFGEQINCTYTLKLL